MNKYIKEQLNKVKVCKVPQFNDSTEVIFIKQQPLFDKVKNQPFEENHYYLIELEDYVINPPPGFSLHTNWNNNISPTQKYYKCQVVKVMNKMIKILGVGWDNIEKKDLDNEIWDGWLPIKSVNIISEIY